MGVPTWMFKRGAFGREESRIFDSDECAALEKQGWVDTPAKLPAPKPAKASGTAPANKPRRRAAKPKAAA